MSEAEYNFHGVELAVSQRRRGHLRARALSARRIVILGLCLPIANLAERTCCFFPRLNLHCHCAISSSRVEDALTAPQSSQGRQSQVYRTWYHFADFPMEFSTFGIHSRAPLHACPVRRAAPIQQLETSTAAPQRRMLLDVSGGSFSAISDERLTLSFS